MAVVARRRTGRRFAAWGAYSLSPVPAGPGRLLLTHRDDASLLIEVDPDAGAVDKVWESRSIRNSYALLVYQDGFFYAFGSRFLTCVDAETGLDRWRSRAPGDGFPILAEGHLVIQTKEGGLHVARATPAGYEERAALPLFADHSRSSPSLADGAIYSRGLREIARVDPGTDVAATTICATPTKRGAWRTRRWLEALFAEKGARRGFVGDQAETSPDSKLRRARPGRARDRRPGQ